MRAPDRRRWRGRAAAAAAACAALFAVTACGSFQSQSIVLDLRVLAMTTTPPEIVAPITGGGVSLGDLSDVKVCALVADPGKSRKLEFTMRACPPTDSGRCDDATKPIINFASGEVGDPELAAKPVSMCGTLSPSTELLTVLRDSLSAADYAGLGGVKVQIELVVTPADGGQPVYAVKHMLYSPEIPAGRKPNQNPSIDAITAIPPATGARDVSFTMPRGRCGDVDPPVLAPGDEITLLPVETPGSRQTYVLPTLSGGSKQFTEYLSYSWYATAGHLSRETSGGRHDFAGNVPPLDSTFTAPKDPKVVGNGLDVSLWLVQRDERGGQSYYESCVRVTP